MENVQEVSRLLAQWESQNSAGADVTDTLKQLAEIFEAETEAFLKQDPDPFDDRHPSRLQPDCTLGHMLKTIFRNENFVDAMVKTYCRRDAEELNTAVCRLLLDILPGLESVIFQEDGFVPKLFHWAEKARNPLQSYATGLLGAAMDVPEIAANYRDRNAYFVPLMLRRLQELSVSYLRNCDSTIQENGPGTSKQFAFSHCNSNEAKSPSPSEDQQESSSQFCEKAKPVNRNGVNKRSLTHESEKEQYIHSYMMGCYQVYPLTPVMQQRYILQYLTPMGEYQDLIGHIFEANALNLIVRYIDLQQNPNVQLAFEALKYLASLLCHKKIAIEFLNTGGLQLLLRVPYPSIAATGVSLCLYYLAYIEEAMEKICLLPSSIVTNLVSYALWLLECSHDSSRCHATMFFGFAFAFRSILIHFDKQDGLRKLFNVMSTLDVRTRNRNLSDDQIFSNRQTTRHVCVALKRYFEAHLALLVEEKNCFTSLKQDILMNHNPPKQDQAKCDSKFYKALDLTYESIEHNIQMLHDSSVTPMLRWRPVDKFLHFEGVSFLLELISAYFELSYSGRAETVKSALDILKICSLTSPTQLLFCEKISSPAYLHVTGINVLLQAAEGELMPVPDIQRAALEIIINCVCTKLPSSGAENSSRPSLASKKKVLSQEEHLSKLWKCVRIKNGIIVLINLLSIKSPLTDADSIRALACKALCGLARSDHVKQIISKLPLVTDGQLLDLMKEPVLQDKGNDHVLFCKYGLELIQRVTGAPISAGSELSMLNINKSEIVAKTKVVYNEAQLLQLISDHLKEHGFYETAECLQREMSKKLISAPSSSSVRTPTRPALWSVWNAGKEKFPKFNNSALTQSSNSNSAMSIPPPSVPLRINRRLKVINKMPQYTEIKSLSGRLQKPQTCSGNYVQSPALRHQEAITPSFGGGSQSSISLHSIVTEYLRKQHALCKNPMITCPPFNLYVPHKCPEPHYRQNAPVNYVLRLHKREIATANGGLGGAALNRKHIYSRFRLVRTFRDVEGNFDFCTSSFLNYNYNKGHPRILIGTVNGTVKVFNVNTANQEFSQDCHVRGVSHVESKETLILEMLQSCSFNKTPPVSEWIRLLNTVSSIWYSPLVITSDGGRLGNSSIWNIEGGVDLLHNFYEVSHMEFGKRTVDRAVGTKHSSASIFDTATFAELQHFPSEELGNNYTPNRATFDYSDQLILSDGLVWDIRSGQMIHKLDKFNAVHNGVFHPNGREIISNSEIWDLRTFKLLRTVAGLSQRCVTFNPAGNIIYGVCTPTDSESKMTENEINCFYVFDADDYNSIATIDVKKPVFHIAADLNEQYVAVVETQSTVDHFSVSAVAGADSVCRLYEIGRTKEEGDEDGEETEDSDDASDEEDNEGESMEIENGDDDDDDDDINHYFIQELSSEEDDETLFSLNTSMEDNL